MYPAPDGSDYSSEGIIAYVDQASSTGTAPLYRFANQTTGQFYYSTTNDVPSGNTTDATLGYVHTTGGTGLIALYRH